MKRRSSFESHELENCKRIICKSTKLYAVNGVGCKRSLQDVGHEGLKEAASKPRTDLEKCRQDLALASDVWETRNFGVQSIVELATIYGVHDEVPPAA